MAEMLIERFQKPHGEHAARSVQSALIAPSLPLTRCYASPAFGRYGYMRILIALLIAGASVSAQALTCAAKKDLSGRALAEDLYYRHDNVAVVEVVAETFGSVDGQRRQISILTLRPVENKKGELPDPFQHSIRKGFHKAKVGEKYLATIRLMRFSGGEGVSDDSICDDSLMEMKSYKKIERELKRLAKKEKKK